MKIRLNIKEILLKSVPIFLLISFSVSSSLFPEPIRAIFAAILILLIPALMGNVLLHISLKILPDFLLRTGILVRLVMSWAVGAYSLLALTYLFYTIGITNYQFVFATVMGIILLELINPHDLFTTLVKNSNKIVNKDWKKPSRILIFELIILTLIGISSVLVFRLFQPYPTYLTSEFSYIQKPLQLIDGSSGIRMAENGVYPIVSILLGLGAYFVNVHPLPFIWILAFFQSIIISIGIYHISKVFFTSRLASFIASFLAMWVFAGASYQNNPYVVSNANLQYVVFVLTILLISRSIFARVDKIGKKSWIILLCVPMIIFVQRLVMGYNSLFATSMILIIPLLLLLLAWRGFFGKKSYFALSLFFMFNLITIVHPFMAPLCLLTLVVFIFSGDLIHQIKMRLNVINNSLTKKHLSNEIVFRPRFLIVFSLIALALILYLVQELNLINFENHFMLSSYLLGNIYSGQIGVDVSFSQKVLFLTRGNPPIILLFFLFGVLVLMIRSLRNKTLDIAIVGAVAMGFILYFFPESFFARARYLVPFFVLCIAGGLAWLLSASVSHKLLHMSLRKKFISAVVFLLCGLVLVQSATPIIGTLMPIASSGSLFSTFEPYEYEAGTWLRSSMQNLNGSGATILSDPYTTNLMSGLTNINPPYKKEWVDTAEYSSASLSIMNSIRKVLTSANFTGVLKEFLLQHNCSLAFVIVNGRTTQWLNQDPNSKNQFIYSTNGVPWSVDKYYVQKLSILSSGPQYSVAGKEYIFKFDINGLELQPSNLETIANLYSAMNLEANDAYSFAKNNNYYFTYWNVTSDRRSSITTSYMAMTPLWVYIVSGNQLYLEWAERSLDFLYVNSSYSGLIVPFDINNGAKVLNASVKIDYSLRFVGAATNLYEITNNSTFLQMAKKMMDGLLTVYTNVTTGLPKGDQYNPINKKLNDGCSTVYFGDYMTLLYKLYQLTGNSTYYTIISTGLNQLLTLQVKSPTLLITEGLSHSGHPIGNVCVNPADFISGLSEFYILSKNQIALNLMETQASAFIKYGFNSTLQRFVYQVNTQTGMQIDLNLFESWAYASVGAYSWLFSVTSNKEYLSCAEKTFDTYYNHSLFKGIHISQIGVNNEPIKNSSYCFLGKNFDLPYGFFWLYYSTKNQTVRSIFSNLVVEYLDNFRCAYGFGCQKSVTTGQFIDSGPGLPVICRTYELSLLMYFTDKINSQNFATCHQSSYYFGPLLNLDNGFLEADSDAR